MGPHICVAASRGVRRACLLSSSLLAIPFWLDAVPAFAQPVALPSVQVDVTSPTTVPTPIDQVASSVTVITAAEIAREQRRTLPDALSTVPGLNIVQTGGPGGQTSVFLRGTNSNHVKVLLDGIDVTDPSNPNQSFDFAHMLTGDIERIEVLRGPQSGLYGADAIGGVISITTKKGEGPPKAYGTMEGGSFGTFNQYAGVSGSQDRFSYAFNVQHWRSTSTPVTPTALLSPGEKRNNDLYDNKTFSTRMGYDFNDAFSVNVVTRYTDAKLRFTSDFNDNAGPDFLQSEQLSHQSYTRGEGVWSLFDGRFKNYFGVAYTNVQSQNTFPVDAGLIPSNNEGTRTKFDWRGVASVAEGQTVVVGLEDEMFGLIHSGPFGGVPVASNANKAAYVEWQAQFAQRFFLVSNVRHDDNDAFGSHQTFRLAPAFLVPGTETKLKASYGTGFKAPTLSQLHSDFPPQFFSNPNLQPEESKGWDAGFEQPFVNDRVRVGATYFHIDITNLIQTAAIPGQFAVTPFGPAAIETSVNIGQATTSGVEAFASFIVTERLKLRTDYTYTKAIDDGSGFELLRRPRNKVSLTAAWTPIDPLTLSATVLHVSNWADIDRETFAPIQADGYTVVNLAANYAVDQNVTVFGRIDNLFDQHYQNPSGFERPGIGVFGGVRVSNR